jgi:hypothetical protein
MTGLELLPVATNKWQVLAFLVFEAHLPAIEQFGPGVDVGQLRVLVWSFELSAHDVFETVVRDDMVVRPLVLDGYGLLHQTTLFEFIAVNERPAKASLLIWGEALGEVGVYFAVRICLSNGSVKCRALKLIVRMADAFSSLSNMGTRAFLALSLGAARWVQRRLFLLGLQCSYKLAID